MSLKWHKTPNFSAFREPTNFRTKNRESQHCLKQPVKTILDVVKDVSKEKSNDIKEEVDEIMDFSYEKALQSVKEERLKGAK